MAHPVDIYLKATCPFCQRARQLLDSKGVVYQVFDIGQQPELRAEMIERSGGASTVPQIFINQKLIGGCDDLYALDSQGELDALLQVS